MNAKLWVAIVLATTTVSLASNKIFNRASNADTADINVKQAETNNYQNTRPTDRVSFYCGEIPSEEGEATIPATIAYVPQRKADVAIIAWKSDYIPQWDAQKRCETVSPKFQAFHEDGRLDYLTTGENNGYPIICAVVETGQQCIPTDFKNTTYLSFTHSIIDRINYFCS